MISGSERGTDPVVITGMARTPMGGFLGAFAGVKTTTLGASVIRAAISRGGIQAEKIDEVIMGCVLPAGLGQAPARQAAIAAGITKSTGCTTINKVCGSGMKAIMLAHDLLRAGSNKIMVAGGMENMSNAPHMLTHARTGYRFGHGQLIDHMAFDGLEDAYEGKSMGVYAESCADKYHFSREDQDNFAINSLQRAQAAIASGAFKQEIIPLEVNQGGNLTIIDTDEQPGKAKLEKIPRLPPAFRQGGTVTAANSSSISDGAAAVVMMLESQAKLLGLTPLARIVAHTTHAQEPAEFTLAPIGAITALFKKTGWTTESVDLFEINEAFAVVPMAAMQELALDHAKVNVHGGACALGHPIGCSGTRIVVTLLAALAQRQKKKGIASLCIGGGEATAIAIELL